MYEMNTALEDYENAIRAKRTEKFVKIMEETRGWPAFPHSLEGLLIAKGTPEMICCYLHFHKLSEANVEFLRCKYPEIHRRELLR